MSIRPDKYSLSTNKMKRKNLIIMLWWGIIDFRFGLIRLLVMAVFQLPTLCSTKIHIIHSSVVLLKLLFYFKMINRILW